MWEFESRERWRRTATAAEMTSGRRHKSPDIMSERKVLGNEWLPESLSLAVYHPVLPPHPRGVTQLFLWRAADSQLSAQQGGRHTGARPGGGKKKKRDGRGADGFSY